MRPATPDGTFSPAYRPRRDAPASMTPWTRSGQQSYRTEWHSHVRVRPRASAAATSSAMMRCKSAQFIFSLSRGPTPSTLRLTSVPRPWALIHSFFQRTYLREPPDVPRLVHRRAQPHVDDVERVLRLDQRRSEAQAHWRRYADAHSGPSSHRGTPRLARRQSCWPQSPIQSLPHR